MFNERESYMCCKDGTKFNIVKRGRLYYFESCGTDSLNKTCDLMTWHELLGHCNLSDVEKLEHVVTGMKIASKEKAQCETCILGKGTE